MTQRTWPLPCYLRHFQIFDKNDSFPKIFLNALIKWHVWRTVLFVFNCFANWFISSVYGRLQQKIGPSWSNYLLELQSYSEYNTNSTELDFCIISDCKSLFNNKLKNVLTSKNSFHPAKTQPWIVWTTFLWLPFLQRLRARSQATEVSYF